MREYYDHAGITIYHGRCEDVLPGLTNRGIGCVVTSPPYNIGGEPWPHLGNWKQGDSAGGHLSAAASLMPNMIGSRGFGKTPGVFEFLPSYLPKGKTAEQVRVEMMKAIKAAAPSYGVFGGALLNPYSDEHANDPAWKEAIAPLSHIPPVTERAVPQFLVRGTNDRLISDASQKEFVDALVKAGQRVEYIQVGAAGHAFFDWKPDDATKATFAKYGVYYAAAMKAFFLSVL